MWKAYTAPHSPLGPSRAEGSWCKLRQDEEYWVLGVQSASALCDFTVGLNFEVLLFVS
jgi:hypothetical protein